LIAERERREGLKQGFVQEVGLVGLIWNSIGVLGADVGLHPPLGLHCLGIVVPALLNSTISLRMFSVQASVLAPGSLVTTNSMIS